MKCENQFLQSWTQRTKGTKLLCELGASLPLFGRILILGHFENERTISLVHDVFMNSQIIFRNI